MSRRWRCRNSMNGSPISVLSEPGRRPCRRSSRDDHYDRADDDAARGADQPVCHRAAPGYQAAAYRPPAQEQRARLSTKRWRSARWSRSAGRDASRPKALWTLARVLVNYPPGMPNSLAAPSTVPRWDVSGRLRSGLFGAMLYPFRIIYIVGAIDGVVTIRLISQLATPPLRQQAAAPASRCHRDHQPVRFVRVCRWIPGLRHHQPGNG